VLSNFSKKFILPCALLLLIPAQSFAQGRAAAVLVDAVIEQELRSSAEVIGRILSLQSGPVTAEFGGQAAEVFAEVGDKVSNGQILAKLDAVLLTAELARAAARLSQAQSLLKAAKRTSEHRKSELERQIMMQSTSGFLPRNLENAEFAMSNSESSVASAQAAVYIAEAEMRIAEVRVEKAEIRAPFDGVIVQRTIALGSYVRVGEDLFELVSIDSYEIEASVPSQFIPSMTSGKTATFVTQDGSTGEAEVRAVLPKQDSRIRNQVVRFSSSLPTAEFNFSDGQPVTLFLTLGDGRIAPTVHKDAVLQKGGQAMVYAAIDGKAVATPLVLGVAVGDRLEIKSGLAAGALVVVRGNERLRPDQDIKYDKPE